MKYYKKTESKILSAALNLFVTKGYHGTSISDIMKKVELTKGALYAHFKSKSSLLFRILEEYETKFIDQKIKETEEYEGNIIDKLNYSMAFSARFAQENLDLCIFHSFVTTELNTDPDFQFELKRVYRKHTNFISDLLSRGIQQGLLKEDLDPELVALSYMAIHDGTLQHWVLNKENIDGRQYAKNYRNVFMNGIVK